jgi:hypothetical protein
MSSYEEIVPKRQRDLAASLGITDAVMYIGRRRPPRAYDCDWCGAPGASVLPVNRAGNCVCPACEDRVVGEVPRG